MSGREARERFAATFPITDQWPATSTTAGAVEGFAAIALAEGHPEHAATLLGAVLTLRGPAARTRPDLARLEATARRALGDERYAAAIRRGAAMGWKEAQAAASAPPA